MSAFESHTEIFIHILSKNKTVTRLGDNCFERKTAVKMAKAWVAEATALVFPLWVLQGTQFFFLYTQ